MLNYQETIDAVVAHVAATPGYVIRDGAIRRRLSEEANDVTCPVRDAAGIPGLKIFKDRPEGSTTWRRELIKEIAEKFNARAVEALVFASDHGYRDDARPACGPASWSTDIRRRLIVAAILANPKTEDTK